MSDLNDLRADDDVRFRYLVDHVYHLQEKVLKDNQQLMDVLLEIVRLEKRLTSLEDQVNGYEP